ncbi:hypothetical protein DCS_02762 [Drechmeria coniospora]|uniref:magnesium chelatase n=1 Tax=Drechmeria coniospora TaxID=98403 RepID=A0A151GWY3_DRECN|nr:hypothetical protein DCS_02762 [Drechmeria coniospora]KYK61619.1 hypothetical protein DCS_02762 [Drechmeria coniospora]
MADEYLLQKVHGLSDLELAVLLCLIGREHGILSTPAEAIDDLVQELLLIARKTFGLECAVVDCDAETTLEAFASALLHPDMSTADASSQPRPASYFSSDPTKHSSSLPVTAGPTGQIANCILAKNLNRAPRLVQIQALELLRTRRIFTRTAVQTAPKQFVFLPLLEARSGGEAHVTAHLNDFFALAHWHDPDDGFVNLDELDDGEADELASTGSVVRSRHMSDATSAVAEPLLSDAEIGQLAQLSKEVQVDLDVLRYQMNIISFLRMHRAVASGTTPTATKHFDMLVRCLAPLHGLDYVTPALVELAARSVYLHRIQITEPEKERSLQWGSSLEAVRAILVDLGPEDVIDEVLETVTAPL